MLDGKRISWGRTTEASSPGRCGEALAVDAENLAGLLGISVRQLYRKLRPEA